MAQSRMNGDRERWHIFSSGDALRDEVVRRLSSCADEAIRQRGVFHLVLAGGHTPAAIYAQLASLPLD